MKYQLILLNNPSRHHFTKALSSFVCMDKPQFGGLIQFSSSVLVPPDLIVMQADSENLEDDLRLLTRLKCNPVFKEVPVIIFSLHHTVTESMRYFSHGAATCILMPVPPEDWASIVNYIPAYWLQAA